MEVEDLSTQDYDKSCMLTEGGVNRRRRYSVMPKASIDTPSLMQRGSRH
jgi:hypothetical protein